MVLHKYKIDLKSNLVFGPFLQIINNNYYNF